MGDLAPPTLLPRERGGPAAARTGPPPARGSAGAKGRSLWWTVHHWTGLKLSLFMGWVLLTGTFAVFSVEMDWLARPALRVAPQAAPLAPWGTLATNAQATGVGEISSIYAPPHAWFAAEAMAYDEASDTRTRIYLDPWRGDVRGTGAWMSFQRFFREMHRHLLLPAKYGIPIVSSLSLLLIASLVSGLMSYKKFWRGFFRRPHFGNARRTNGDLHRLAGLWSLWFVALIALTGVWYLVESLGGDAPYNRAPELAETALPALDAAAIDRFAAIAQAAYPALRIKELRLPGEPGEPVGFFGQAGDILVRDRVNGVWIDPVDGRVVEVMRGRTLGVHQRISEMADPLHFGTFGGMWTKIIWFVFGLAMTALAVTGAAIYTLRLARARAPDERAERPHGWASRLWRGMGLWAYPAAAIVLFSLAMIPGWLGE